MSTRCHIGIILPDKRVKSAYALGGQTYCKGRELYETIKTAKQAKAFIDNIEKERKDDIRFHENEEDYLAKSRSWDWVDIEYFYLFDKGEWWFYENPGPTKEPVKGFYSLEMKLE